MRQRVLLLPYSVTSRTLRKGVQVCYDGDCLAMTLTGVDTHGAHRAADQRTGAVLIQVRSGQLSVRTSCEAHLRDQWLRPELLLLSGRYRCSLDQSSQLTLGGTGHGHGRGIRAFISSTSTCMQFMHQFTHGVSLDKRLRVQTRSLTVLNPTLQRYVLDRWNDSISGIITLRIILYQIQQYCQIVNQYDMIHKRCGQIMNRCHMTRIVLN